MPGRGQPHSSSERNLGAVPWVKAREAGVGKRLAAVRLTWMRLRVQGDPEGTFHNLKLVDDVSGEEIENARIVKYCVRAGKPSNIVVQLAPDTTAGPSLRIDSNMRN